MAGTPEPVAALAARAWLEDGDATRLRVRLTTTTDVVEDGARTVVVADVDDACAVVRDWLARLLDEAGRR